jgi:hypothetical protein
VASDTGDIQPPWRKTKRRSLDELMKPDLRSASFVRVNLETGETAHIDIQDTEQMLVEIEASLTSAAPEEIRRRVGVARDLIVYAWFCYVFLAVSMFWCLSCIEMALAAKFEEMNPGQREVKGRRSFQSLLDWASKMNLLPDNAYPEAVRKLRNSLAHPQGLQHGCSARNGYPRLRTFGKDRGPIVARNCAARRPPQIEIAPLFSGNQQRNRSNP